MTDARFERSMKIFEAACDLPPTERGAFLDEACAGDVALRNDVESLLACDAPATASPLDAHFDAGAGARELARRIHESDPGSLPLRGLNAAQPSTVLGGKYRVLRKIGQGGMGEVYEAEQSMPRRRVAIKIMRPGLSSARALRRFEHEAHVLGRLQHPGIAQIYEVGAIAPDRPDDAFFAMEFIDGESLDVFAATRALSTNQRLELVARVADAVQHAHQRGVIHRDLKPANILVEASGQPKILDFGVARVANDDGQLTRSLTTVGQIIGTLAYMSPEQVSGDPAAVDVRSDVYALGVILFELLAKRLPLDPNPKALSDALRMIKEDDPPRLGSIDRSFRGDVEVIVLKALEKQPSRRYQSAAELADDLRRAVRGEAIVARNQSALYVGRRFLRKHPVAAVAASLIAMALTFFGVYSRWQAERFKTLATNERALRVSVEHARTESDRLREEADAAAASLARKLRESDIERGHLLARTGAMGPAEELLWPEYLRDPNSLIAHYGLREAYRQQGLRATIRASSASVEALSQRPDGRLVCGDVEGRLVIIEPSTGAIEADVTLGSKILAIDARARDVIAVVVTDGTLTLHDPRSLAIVPSQFSRAAQPLIATRAIATSPDGTLLAVALADRTLAVMTLDTQQVLWTSAPRSVAPYVLAWRPDGRELAAAGSDRQILVYAHDTNQPSPVEPIARMEGHESGIASLCWADDGTTLWSGSSDRTVKRWDRRSARESASWRYPNGTIRYAELSRDNRTLIVAGWWSVDRLDPWTGERLASAIPGTGAVGLVLSADAADGLYAVTSHIDGCVRLWSFRNAPERRALPSVAGPARCAFSRASSDWIVVGDRLGEVRTFDAASLLPTGMRTELGSPVRSVRFANQDRTIIVLTGDGVLHAIDAATGRVTAQAPGVADSMSTTMEVSPDGMMVATGLPNGTIRLHSVPDLQHLRHANPGIGGILGVAFHPNGQMIATIGRSKIVKLLDTTLTERGSNQQDVGTAWAPAFSHDGHTLAAGTWVQSVQLWSVPDLTLGQKLLGHGALPWIVRFDRKDTRILYSAGEDGQWKTWDITTGNLLATARPFPTSDIANFDLAPDGRFAVLGSSLGDVAVIDLTYDDQAVEGNRAAAIARFRVDRAPRSSE